MNQESNKSKRFTPGRILLYVLTPIVFLFVGAAVSGLVGAADGQGLASGAIVLFHGLLTAIAALIIVLIIAPFLAPRTVRIINLILFGLVLMGVLWILFRASDNTSAFKEKDLQPKRQTTAPADIK